MFSLPLVHDFRAVQERVGITPRSRVASVGAERREFIMAETGQPIRGAATYP